jgi:PAS domain S-box-containing protein
MQGTSTIDDTGSTRPTEQELRVVEETFRLIVDSIPVPVAVTTPTGEVESLNRPTLEYFGKTFEDLKGWKASDVVHPDDLQHTIAAQTEAHEKGHAYNVESRHRRADGTYRWFNVLGLPLRDAQGNILRWFHLQIDIDDRKRAEEALRARQLDLTQIINTIPALAWSARRDGSAEFFNQHYLDYLGLTLEQASDWGWTVVVHPEDRDALAATWQRIMDSEKPGEAEARLRRHDGVYRWFLFRANPLRDESGKVVKWYGQNTDIQDRKQGELLLRESELQFKTIFDEAGTGITLVDLKRGEPIRNNRALQDMLGCSEEELGRFETYDEVTHRDDREKVAI